MNFILDSFGSESCYLGCWVVWSHSWITTTLLIDLRCQQVVARPVAKQKVAGPNNTFIQLGYFLRRNHRHGNRSNDFVDGMSQECSLDIFIAQGTHHYGEDTGNYVCTANKIELWQIVWGFRGSRHTPSWHSRIRFVSLHCGMLWFQIPGHETFHSGSSGWSVGGHPAPRLQSSCSGNPCFHSFRTMRSICFLLMLCILRWFLPSRLPSITITWRQKFLMQKCFAQYIHPVFHVKKGLCEVTRSLDGHRWLGFGESFGGGVSNGTIVLGAEFG